MQQNRIDLYVALREEIGNTPLYRVSHIGVPNNNVIFVKEENRNPGGSHYDRVFINLFEYYENLGRIIPGYTPIVETTSGSAGASAARFARLLGYECLAVCPVNLPSSRLEAIRREGAELRLTPAEKYINGSAEELGRIVRVENKERKRDGKVPYFALNHTQGEAAAIAAEAVERVIDEAVIQAEEQYGVRFNLAIAAGGNGTTLLGFGRGASLHGFPLVAWETLGSGYYFNKRFGNGAFEWKYGLNPGFISPEHHQLLGTVYGQTPFSMVNIDQAFQLGFVDNVRILADSRTKEKALELTTTNFGRSNILRLQSWESFISLLRDIEGKPVGRSSAGNLAMILDEQWGIRDMKILTFFYDDLSRYN